MFGVLISVQLLVHVLAEWDIDGLLATNRRCQTPDLSVGLCLPVHHCYSMINFLQQFSRPLPKKIETFLDRYACENVDNATPKICCTPNPIVLHEDPTIPTLPDVSTHKNLALLPSSCGRATFSSKITLGEGTGIFEFPWMALIAYSVYQVPKFLCGGSIINERYILTAAHCVTRLEHPLHSVRVGEHNWNTENDCEYTKEGVSCAPPYQDQKIEQIIPHEKYSWATQKNDIGLLRVSRIDLTPGNSRPVCLPLGEARNYNFDKEEVIVSGWGFTEHREASPQLLKVSLPFVPLDICQTIYPEVDHRQICAGGADGRDSCSGDSGGPLMVNATLNGRRKIVQQGIVSYGPTECGTAGIPGMYTKVAAFMDWILDNLKP